MKTVFQVDTSSGRRYPVLCGEGAAEALVGLWRPDWQQAAVIGDENTNALFSGEICRALEPRVTRLLRLSFSAGEAAKTRQSKARLEDAMLGAGLDRSCCVVAVGGGIALDLGGFVAATYMRGVPHVNVATSLLAQVDAAVGGKTGINTPAGKNLIGAFHQPHAVLLDVGSLASLPPAELRNGLAELVKHAVIGDQSRFVALERWAQQEGAGGTCPPPREEIVHSARLKAEVVRSDEREAGRRMILNFGHTIGHAIEAATEHAEPHGRAVAAGMVIELLIGERMGCVEQGSSARVAELLGRLGLPVAPPCPFEVASSYLGRDKKNLAGAQRLALPERIGAFGTNGRWVTEVSQDLIAAVWTERWTPCSA